MKKLLFLLIPFLVLSCVGDERVKVSGRIEGGLRMLPIESDSGDLAFTIFRGDYIVFELDSSDSRSFVVPGLEINEVLPKAEGEKPYVKMKKSGEYEFTLGDHRGVFHVLELTEPNYYELTAAEAADFIATSKPLVIDVRTSGEFEAGHLVGANLIPVQILEENIPTLESFKEDDILLYCASGNRSTVAAKLLIDAGFTKVYNLRNGFGDWARKGNPVE